MADPFTWIRSEANRRERVRVMPVNRLATLHPLPGDNSCVAPPDPIPNSEVKRSCADGSVHLACESRSSPGALPRNPAAQAAGFLFSCSFRNLFTSINNSACLHGLTGAAANHVFALRPAKKDRRIPLALAQASALDHVTRRPNRHDFAWHVSMRAVALPGARPRPAP